MNKGNGHRWATEYPYLGTEPLPAEVFTSREQFELEREHIWKKVWLMMGRVEQIPEAGDYFVKDLSICKTSILVVRGKDGVVRAFHNVCVHRGNKLVWDDSGSCKVFTCKFHGWAYGHDGALQHVPDEENFFDLKRDETPLPSVACDIWNGFVFINVDPNPEESLEEFMGDLGVEVRGYPFSEITATAGVWSAVQNCNWKLGKDSFQESYHIRELHKRGAGGSDEANPHNHWLDVKLFPRHRKAGFGMGSRSRSRNPTGGMNARPSAALAAQYGAMILGTKKPGEPLPPGINPLGHEGFALDNNLIFPNWILLLSAGHIVQHEFWPIEVDRTLWVMTMYYLKAENVGQRWAQEVSMCSTRDVAMEDGSTLEQTQQMLGSGAIKGQLLKDEEILLRHSHDVVNRMITGKPLYVPKEGPRV